MSPAPTPALRADALRNRDRLLAAGRRAFTAADAAVPLEGIAREAGVGIGTLYRHFPTREALVEAVYAAELDQVVDSAAALRADLPPVDALRAWLDHYGAFVAAKRGLLDTLRTGWSSGRLATSTTRERITATLADLIAAGATAGALRADVDADDVTTMLLGVFLAAGQDAAPERVARLLDLLVDSLRA